MSFVLMFLLSCFFPIFDTDAGEFTGLSIVNPDPQPREFVVTATPSNGTGAQNGRITLNAGAQRAMLLKEILGTSSAPSSGWIGVDSPVTECTSYLASETGETLTGTDAAPSTATTVILPRISVNTGFQELNHIDTTVAVVNPGNPAANVTLTLYGFDGASRGSVTVAVPPLGSRTGRISEMFQTFLPPNNAGGRTFYGHIRLTSNEPIAAWQRIETPLSRSLLRGKSPQPLPSTTLAVIPHFVFGGTYDAFVNFLNPSSASLSLELTAFDDRGRAIGEPVSLTLSAGESRRASIPELFRVVVIAIFPPPVITGYIRIRESQNRSFQIMGDVEIISSSGGGIHAAMIYPIVDSAGTGWLTPFAVSFGRYFTGYSIVNPNEFLTVQTDVQIDVVSSDGAVVNRSTLSLSARMRQAALVPPGIAGGYLRFTSNFPIQVMGAIGTQDLRLLDQLPAILR